MPASRPRRVRIAALLIILCGRTVIQLNNSIDGSTDEILDAQICRAMPLMAIADNALTAAQIAVWDDIDDLATMFDNNASPDDKDLSDASSNLESALGTAGL